MTDAEREARILQLRRTIPLPSTTRLERLTFTREMVALCEGRSLTARQRLEAQRKVR